jgi:D-sedoheptulose 7-phosphate isomerase
LQAGAVTSNARDRRMQKSLELAHTYFQESIAAKMLTQAHCLESVVAAARLIVDCLRVHGKLLICGNGGSAADSQHLAAEFVSLLDHHVKRPAMAAIALTTDTSILTAISNDFGYALVFERQIEALGRPGDVLLGISTSGNSDSVVRAVRAASQSGMKTVTLVGGDGGKIAPLADVAIVIPSKNIQHIQESHIAVEHLLCHLAEKELFLEGVGE